MKAIISIILLFNIHISYSQTDSKSDKDESSDKSKPSWGSRMPTRDTSSNLKFDAEFLIMLKEVIEHHHGDYVNDNQFKLILSMIFNKTIDEKVFQDVEADIVLPGDDLDKIQTPTLILWGDNDRVLHVDNAEELHLKITGSKKVILEGVGHMPMIEVPGETSDHFIRFISSIKK